MPPFAYLEGSPSNIYALQNLGSTFSNAVLGMAQHRMQMQHMAAQQALAQQELSAKLPIYQAQEKNYQAEAAMHQAQAAHELQMQGGGQATGRLFAQNNLPPEVLAQIVRDPEAMQQMVGDLRSAGVMPMGAFQMSAPRRGVPEGLDPMMQSQVPDVPPELQSMIQAAIRGNVAGSAASSPSSAVQLMQPERGGQFAGYDWLTNKESIPATPGVETPHQMEDIRVKDQMQRDQAQHYAAVAAELQRYHDMESENSIASSKLKALTERVGPLKNKPIEGIDEIIRSVYPPKGGGTNNVPAAPQRQVGKTYSLPKGNFTWTMNGWVPAQ